MTIEIIPSKYRGGFDAFSDVDDELVKAYVLQKLSSGEDTIDVLRRNYSREAKQYPEYLRRLVERGMCLEPANDDLEVRDKDMPLMKIFNAGVSLATIALDTFAYEVGISSASWRNRWQKLPPHSDFIHLRGVDDAVTPDDIARVGDRLIAYGQRDYERLNGNYQEIFEHVNTEYEDAIASPQVFRSSYGFVMRFGQKVIQSFSYESRLDAAVDAVMQKSSVNEEIKYLISRRERRSLRKELHARHSNNDNS